MEDHAERIVKEATKQGAQDAVAEVVVDRNHQIRFAQNQPVIVNRWRKRIASVFLAHDKRVVVGEITNFAKIPVTIAKLIKVAKASQPNPEFVGIAKGPFNYGRAAVDPGILALEDGGGYVQAALDGAPEEGAKETAGSCWRYDEEHFLNTSNGVAAQDRRVGLYLSIRALVSLESSGHGVSCATKVSQFHPESAGHKAGRIAALAEKPRGGASAGAAGLSPYGDKLGKPVASPVVTLYDDGSADTLGRRRFDQEGVPTKKTAIVQKGVLKTYLHNTSTAKKFKTRTTANAGLISPEPHALGAAPGDWTRDELFREVKDGLWLTNTWDTRYQSYVTGDFSTIPRDGIFRIRKGEIAEAWKDIRLTDNLINVWKSVKALSKTREQVTWWGEVSVATMAPYALAQQIGITKSAL